MLSLSSHMIVVRVLPLTSRESRETTSYHPKAYKHAEKQIMSSKEQAEKENVGEQDETSEKVGNRQAVRGKEKQKGEVIYVM